MHFASGGLYLFSPRDEMGPIGSFHKDVRQDCCDQLARSIFIEQYDRIHSFQVKRQFRARVVEAGAALAAVSPHVVEWGPDAGFIGDGRLVRFQADRLS